MVKNKVQVNIDGKMYSITGSETEEHIQKVAKFMNQQLLRLKKQGIAGGAAMSRAQILLMLQIADDYIKLQEQFESYAKELQQCNEENMLLLERIDELGLEIGEIRVNKCQNSYTN